MNEPKPATVLGANTLSVLIVDDSDFFGSMLGDKLESNYDIEAQTTTRTATVRSFVEDGSVDCIVSDYQMPEMTGLELYERVGSNSKVPFVLLTSEGDEEIASKAISMGVDEYLLKTPIIEGSLDLLVNRIRNVVNQYRTRQKYANLVENSPDGILQLTQDGEILAANETIAMELGVDQPELLGETLSTFLPEDVANGRLEEAKRAIKTGNAVTFQDSVGVRHFHNIAVPVSVGRGGRSVQLVTREITHQKHSEQKLSDKNRMLAMINRIVRHDINNDVQLLMTWSDQLHEHVDEGGKEIVDNMHDTGEHIAELTTIARNFVQSLDGDTNVELEPVDIGSVLRSEVEKKQTAHPDATISIGTIPDVRVRANELASSVFGNLLSNAVRHNTADDPYIRVGGTENESTVVFRIADNGPGIPDGQKKEIFGKGEMGPESPGTGIGLYLVRTLVEQYNGKIWVEDNDPTGAVFVVELPTTTVVTEDAGAPGWGET